MRLEAGLWKQADNSLVSRRCQFFFAHRKIPLRLSTIRKLKPQIDLSLPKSSFEPYRKAAELLAGFLPIEPTEGHVTARKRTLAVGACLENQSLRREADNPPITAPRDLAHRQTRGSPALGCPQQRSHPDTRAVSDRLCPVVGELKHAARLIYFGGCRLLFGSKKPHSGGFVGHPKCYPVSAAPLSAAYRCLQKPKGSLSSYDRNGRARQSRMRPAHHAGSLQESNHDRHSTGNSVPDHRPRGKER